MTDYSSWYQEVTELAAKFNRWMTFIEIIEIAGLVLSITALVLLVVKIIRERKEGDRI